MRRNVVLAATVILLTGATAFADWEAGVAAFQGQDFNRALREFKAVVEQSPTYAGAHYMLGLTLQRLNRTEEAIKALQDATRLEPTNAQYAVPTARALLSANRPQDAERAMRAVRAEGLQPQQRQLVLATQAQIAMASGDESRGLTLLQQATQVNPRNADVLAQYGVALSRADRNKEAFETFRRAWDLGQNESYGRNACAAGIRAAQLTRNESEARTLFRQVATLAGRMYEHKASPDTALTAGEAYLGASDFNSALEWFDRTGVDNALVLMYKGQAHASLNRLAPAEQNLRRALEREPDTNLRRQIYNSLGFVLDKAGKYVEAARAYQEIGDSAKVAEMREKEAKRQQNIQADEESARIAELERLAREYEDVSRPRTGPTPRPQ